MPHPWVPRVHLCPSEAGLFGLSDLGRQDARRSKGGGVPRVSRDATRGNPRPPEAKSER